MALNIREKMFIGKENNKIVEIEPPLEWVSGIKIRGQILNAPFLCC